MTGDEGRPVSVAARDGYALAGKVFLPTGETPGTVVVINSATAVPQGYYRGFARYLAERSAAALTYDYRGIGGSAPARLRGFEARMRDWAEQDVAGAIDWAGATFPHASLRAVGHSVGGHALGLACNNHRIDRAVAVAAQSGYWGFSATPERYRVLALMGAVLPALTHTVGYGPASRLGIGEDLPKGVLLEWARWCRMPEYFFADETLASLRNFGALACPLLSVRAADDPWATERAVGHFVGHFTNAQVTHRVIEPGEAGVDKLGHFGPFRSRVKETVWREMADWVLA